MLLSNKTGYRQSKRRLTRTDRKVGVVTEIAAEKARGPVAIAHVVEVVVEVVAKVKRKVAVVSGQVEARNEAQAGAKVSANVKRN